MVGRYSEILTGSETWQDGYAEWLIEQVLCGEYEPYVEGGFIEIIEELIPLTKYTEVKARLLEGWKRYWFGVPWFAKDLAIKEWLDYFHCDRTCMLPLEREVVVIDRDDIEHIRLGG